jgi:hypothetical protein
VSTVSDQPIRRAPLLTNRGRRTQAAAAHWHTHKYLLAELIGVSQLAMINDDFADYWAEICYIPTSFITEMERRAQSDGFCAGDGPQLIAMAMLNQFCYLQLTGPEAPDDEACISTLTNIFYRAIYFKEGR